MTSTSGSLQVTYDNPLFPDSIIWYPGLTVHRSMTVTNLGGSTQTFQLEAINTSETGNIAAQMRFWVNEGSTSLYPISGERMLRDFWNDGEVQLSQIEAGKTKTYEVFVNLKDSVGNDFQNTSAKFDLRAGFQGSGSEVTVLGISDVKPTPRVRYSTTTSSNEEMSSSAAAELTVTPTPAPQILGSATGGRDYRPIWVIGLIWLLALLLLLLLKRRRKRRKK